jgi:hypothetical protein
VIRNDFPAEVLYAYSDPPPGEVSEDRRTVWWSVGAVAKGEGGNVTVTVELTDTLLFSTTLGVWYGIYSHVGWLHDDVYLDIVLPGTRFYLPVALRS